MYTCHLCRKNFSTAWNLTRHSARVHPRTNSSCHDQRSSTVMYPQAQTMQNASNSDLIQHTQTDDREVQGGDGIFSDQPILPSSMVSCSSVKRPNPEPKTLPESLNLVEEEDHSQIDNWGGQTGSGLGDCDSERSSSSNDEQSQSSGSGIGEVLPCFESTHSETEDVGGETEGEEDYNDEAESEDDEGELSDCIPTGQTSSEEEDNVDTLEDSCEISEEVSSVEKDEKMCGAGEVEAEKNDCTADTQKFSNSAVGCNWNRSMKMMYWKPLPNRFRLAWRCWGKKHLVARHCAWLGKLFNASHEDRLKMLLDVTASQIDCISEICINFLQGYVPITRCNYRKFEKFVSILRTLGSEETTFRRKQRSLLHSHPSFLTLLIKRATPEYVTCLIG